MVKVESVDGYFEKKVWQEINLVYKISVGSFICLFFVKTSTEYSVAALRWVSTVPPERIKTEGFCDECFMSWLVFSLEHIPGAETDGCFNLPCIEQVKK